MNKKDFNKKTFIVTAYETNKDKIAFLSSPIIRELIRDKKLIHFHKSFGKSKKDKKRIGQQLHKSFGQWINDEKIEMLEKGFFIELKNDITYCRFLEIAENIRIYLKQECVTFQYYNNISESTLKGLLYKFNTGNPYNSKIYFFNNVTIGINALKYDCFTIVQAQKLIFSFKF